MPGLGRQVERLDDAEIRDLCRVVQLLDGLLIVGFGEAHAARLARDERAPDVTDLRTLCGELLAGLDRSLLRRAELVHRDALEFPLDHVNGHVRPPCVFGRSMWILVARGPGRVNRA